MIGLGDDFALHGRHAIDQPWFVFRPSQFQGIDERGLGFVAEVKTLAEDSPPL